MNNDHFFLMLKLFLVLVAVVGLVYLARAVAYAYIYVATAMRSERAGRAVRKFFPKIALEVDKAREAAPPDTLRQTDDLFREGLRTTLRKIGKILLYVLLGTLVVIGFAWLLRQGLGR